MTTAVIVNPYEIKKIQDRVVNPSNFLVMGKRIHRLAKIVKQEWHNFEEEDRDFLIKLADDLIEPNNNICNFPQKVWSFIYTLMIKVIGQEKEFLFCIDAVDCLVDNIFDAMEQENTTYQEVLSNMIKEVKSNPDIGESIDAQDGKQWLKDLSDKAFTEI